MSRALFFAGAVFLLAAIVAMIGVVTNYDLSLRMMPTLFLPLPNALVGAGDFPKLLNHAGVIVVYGLPAAVLLVLARLTRRRTGVS